MWHDEFGCFLMWPLLNCPIPWPRSTSNMDWQATTRLWLPKWFEGSTHVCWQHPPCLSFSITRVPSLDWNPVSAGYLLTYQVRLMMFFFTTSIHIHHYYISPMTFPWKKSYILNRFPYFKKKNRGIVWDILSRSSQIWRSAGSSVRRCSTPGRRPRRGGPRVAIYGLSQHI